jgi:hypothetical protein
MAGHLGGDAKNLGSSMTYVEDVDGGPLGGDARDLGAPPLVSHPEILISECEPFSHKKLKISKRIHLF